MTRDLRELQRLVLKFVRERRWEKFHTPKNLAMAMSVEAAEVVEILQWLTPAQSARLSGRKREELADELADTFVYLLRLAHVYKIDLVAAAFRKMGKNAAKYPVEKARGRMTKYNEL